MDTKFAVAVHTLLFISESPEPKTSETISQTLHTNASYVRKILSGLVKAGMITSATKSKDCCLLKQPEEILLSELLGVPFPPGGTRGEQPQRRAEDQQTEKAVDSLADRLIFKGFKDDNLDLQQILDMNNPDILPDSAILSAMISSCSFIYIADNAGDVPRLEVIDGGNATGIMDPVTGFLTEGYAVLKRDDQRRPVLEAYFTPGRTEYYEGNKLIRVDLSRAPYPLLVPIVYRPDARRPFGHSRISRACMNLQSMAKRTLVRMDISADFYSYPQRYALGTSQDADKLDTWKAAVTTMLEITKDDEGEKPVVGQFQQQTMSPYTEQLRAIASMFARAASCSPSEGAMTMGKPM